MYCTKTIVNLFPKGGLEEISLVLFPDRVIVKSYVDNEKTEASLMKKLLLTEMTLNPSDFEVYDFNTNKRVQLTFCLKEMKVRSSLFPLFSSTSSPHPNDFEAYDFNTNTQV